jgi:hypothetical protein
MNRNNIYLILTALLLLFRIMVLNLLFIHCTPLYITFSWHTHALGNNKYFGYALRYPVRLEPYNLPKYVSSYIRVTIFMKEKNGTNMFSKKDIFFNFNIICNKNNF